jgi:hypothetical protein
MLFISESPLARELIRIGDEAIARDDEVAFVGCSLSG